MEEGFGRYGWGSGKEAGTLSPDRASFSNKTSNSATTCRRSEKKEKRCWGGGWRFQERCKELQDQLKTTQEQVNELQAELTYLQSEKEKLKKSAVTPEVLAKRNEDLKKQYEDLLQTKTEIEREIGEEEKRRRRAEEQTQQSRHLRNSEFWQLSQQIIWPVACGLGICAGLRLSIPKVIQGVTCTWQALGNASRAAQQNAKTNIVDAYKATPWPTKQKKLALSGRGLTLLASGKAGVQSTISAITAERRSGEEQLAALRRPFIAEKRPAPEIWLPRPEFRVSKGCSDGANQVLNHFGSIYGVKANTPMVQIRFSSSNTPMVQSKFCTALKAFMRSKSLWYLDILKPWMGCVAIVDWESNSIQSIHWRHVRPQTTRIEQVWHMMRKQFVYFYIYTYQAHGLAVASFPSLLSSLVRDKEVNACEGWHGTRFCAHMPMPTFIGHCWLQCKTGGLRSC